MERAARPGRVESLDRAEAARHPTKVRVTRKIAPLTEEALDRAVERFRVVLHDRSLKLSKVRETVARTALTYEGHFTVEDLVRVLHANGVRDGHLATVYRAVPLMVEAGLIQVALVSKSDGQRYEAIFEREPHDHLICTLCERVVEYRSEVLAALQREIAERYDFELDDYVHELRGRCKDCRRAAPEVSPRSEACL